MAMLVQGFSFLTLAADSASTVGDLRTGAESDHGIMPCAYTICSCGGTAALRCGYYHLDIAMFMILGRIKVGRAPYDTTRAPVFTHAQTAERKRIQECTIIVTRHIALAEKEPL